MRRCQSNFAKLNRGFGFYRIHDHYLVGIKLFTCSISHGLFLLLLPSYASVRKLQTSFKNARNMWLTRVINQKCRAAHVKMSIDEFLQMSSSIREIRNQKRSVLELGPPRVAQKIKSVKNNFFLHIFICDRYDIRWYEKNLQSSISFLSIRPGYAFFTKQL